MKLPLISRRHHEEVGALCGRLIAERDARIRELEAERRMLWDKICLLGIGAPAFAAVVLPEEEEKEKDAEARPAASASATLRPSAIMRRMDRMAEERYLRKVHPSRGSEEVVAMLDRIDREV